MSFKPKHSTRIALSIIQLGLYIEGNDLSKLADVAINADGLRYQGNFKAGQRVDGEIYQNGEMIFAGQLVEDKPHGEALCL